MDLSSIWPDWGSKGDKPSDGKDYDRGDNVAAGSLDYLWYYIKDTFEKVETALSNKADDPHDNASHTDNYATSTEVSGKAGDPHGNAAHNPDFAVKGDKQPPENHGNEAHTESYITSDDVDGKASNPHGNGAHKNNFLQSSSYQPVTTIENVTGSLAIDISGDADTVDGQDASELGGSGVANPHGNSAHNPDFLPSSNYNPVSDVEAETSALNIDITGDADTVDGQDASELGGSGVANPHGNGAHNPDFLPSSNYQPVTAIENKTGPLAIDISGDADTVDGQDASELGGSGVADPHGNSAHDPDFLPSSNYQPVADVESVTGSLAIDISGDADTVDGQDASELGGSGVANPHGNSAHNPDFLPSSNYQPVADVENVTGSLAIDISGNADTVDGQDASAFADALHGNSAHKNNFLQSNNYNPVSDVEAKTSALNIDITGDADTVDGQDASQLGNVSNPHGNSAHSNNYLHTIADVDEGGITDTAASELHIDRQLNLLSTLDEDIVALTLDTTPKPNGDVSTAPLVTKDFGGTLDVDITGDADTVDGKDASQLEGGNVSNPHGNGAHSNNYLHTIADVDSGGITDAAASELHIDRQLELQSTLDEDIVALTLDTTPKPNGDVSTAPLVTKDFGGTLDVDITGDADTVDGKDASQLEGGNVSNPHGNSAHSNNYIHTLEDSDTTDTSASTLQFGKQLELLPASGSEDVVSLTLDTKPDLSDAPLVTEDFGGTLNIDITGDADTVDGKDASQLGGNVSNPHGNNAHSENYLTRSEGFAPNTRSEIHRVTNVTLGDGDNNTQQHSIPFDRSFASRPSVHVTMNFDETFSELGQEQIFAHPVVTNANDAVILQFHINAGGSITFDADVLVYGPQIGDSEFPGTTHTATKTKL